MICKINFSLEFGYAGWCPDPVEVDPNSVIAMPRTQTAGTTTIRRLKNADCEVDFRFIIDFAFALLGLRTVFGLGADSVDAPDAMQLFITKL